MEEKVLNWAECLKNGNNVLDVFKNLEKVLEENGLYKELAGCKEKIWHLNGDDTKLKEMAFLYREKLEDYDMGYLINLLYLRRTDRALYDEILSCIEGKGGNELIPDLDDNSDKFSELWKIADRFCGLEYIIIFLFSRKKYDDVLKFIPYLDSVKKLAHEFSEKHPEVDPDDMLDIEDSEKKLSDLFASYTDDIELNKLAIKYNKSNEKAYINILENYINNEKENDALEFYNKDYRKEFDNEEAEDDDRKYKAEFFVDVIWEVSKYYYDNFDLYKSLYFEQKAVEYEMAHRQEGESV